MSVLKNSLISLGLTLALSLSACAKSIVVDSSLHQETRKIPDFNQIIATGNLDLNIHTGIKPAKLIIKGQAADLAKLHTSVNKGMLLLSLPKEHTHRVMIDIYSHYLNHLYYRGKGNIQAQNLNSKMLDLDLGNHGQTRLSGKIYLRQLKIQGSGYTEINGVNSRNLSLKIGDKAKVQLRGTIELSKLELSGQSSLNMYWVNTRKLQVYAKDSALIKLAGIADLLELDLWGQTHFNGRYLRVRESFVKTHNHSLAEITTLDKEHTLASDASDIFFYYPAKFSNDFMAYNGSVLDMRPWVDDNLVVVSEVRSVEAGGVWK